MLLSFLDALSGFSTRAQKVAFQGQDHRRCRHPRTNPPPSAPAPAPASPDSLPEEVRAVAYLLSASPAPLPLATIEVSFNGKGP